MTKPLSPAALATWNAFLEHSEWEVTPAELKGVAAALRTAADQVVPEETWLGTEEPCYAYYRQRCNTRRQLLAIAAELEGSDA